MFGPNHPRLTSTNFAITSVQTIDYNCIAWAAGQTDRWWWPIPFFYYWPDGAPRQVTVNAFEQAFATLGFESCPDGQLEAGFEKIAIYARTGVPTHAARQLGDGRWTSKMGSEFDIEHADVNDVSGPGYGAPVTFMRRRIPVMT